MKKALCCLVTLVLTAVLCSAAFANSAGLDLDRTEDPIEYPYLGFRFDPPEAYRNTKGIVVMQKPYDLSEIVDIVSCDYYAMTEERYAEYMSSHELTIPLNELWIDGLFTLYIFRKGMTFERFSKFSGDYTQEDLDHTREIGKVGDTTYYLYMPGTNPYFVADVDPAYLDEYVAMTGSAEKTAAAFTFFEAEEKPDPYAGLAGSRIEFIATDFDGNPVSSADLFASNKITLVNIWATWCGPCIGELEDLKGIHDRMGKQGIGVVGLLTDDDLDTAQELIDEYNIRYPVVLAPEKVVEEFFPLEGYPSSLFVGPDGTVIAGPVIGAHPEKYFTILNSLLRGNGR